MGPPAHPPSDAPGTGQEAGPQRPRGALTLGDTPLRSTGPPITWRATGAPGSGLRQAGPHTPGSPTLEPTTAFLDSGSAISWQNVAPPSMNHEP